MNMHFDDKELFETLKENSIVKVQIGSHLYGFQNAESDIDYLYIYPRPKKMQESFLWEHHQLQYKEDGVDHIFTDLHTFVRNILTGDSTINFEVLHELEDTPLHALFETKHLFYSYNVIKSYLGLARRDLRTSHYEDDKDGEGYYNIKRIHHAIRGYHSALMVSEGEYTNKWREKHPELFRKALDVKNGGREVYSDTYHSVYTEYTKDLRIKNNERLEKGLIPRMMNPRSLAYIDFVVKSATREHRNYFDIDLTMFYEALENRIKY